MSVRVVALVVWAWSAGRARSRRLSTKVVENAEDLNECVEVVGALQPTTNYDECAVGSDVVVSSPVCIVAAVTLRIYGDGGARALDGGGATRVLEVYNGASVTLEGIAIVNGYVSHEGWGDSKHWYADKAAGGGIFVQGADTRLVMIDSSVTGNVVDGDATVYGTTMFNAGGGLYVESATVTMVRCNVSHNEARGHDARGGVGKGGLQRHFNL